MPYVLIVIAVLARVLPHPFNVTPVGAVGLFAGANCRLRVAWAVPLIALLAGDLIGGFYSPVVMVLVYVGMVGAPLVGAGLLRTQRSGSRYLAAVVGSSTFFFLASNLGVWLAGMYPRTWAGLVECYVMGLPFYGRTLLANGLYALILFGAYELFSRRIVGRQEAGV